MKKNVSLLLLVVFMVGCMCVVQAEEVSITDCDWSVYINEELIDINVKNVDNIPKLPLKVMCEYLGYDYAEDNDGNVVISEGENCKNKLGENKEAKLLKSDTTKYTYISKQDEEIIVDTIVSNGAFSILENELYVSPYFFDRALDISIKNVEWEQIDLYTKDWLSKNTPSFINTIYVSTKSEYYPIQIWKGIPQRSFFCEEYPPFFDSENRTMVTVREFCEWLDMEVKWFEDTQTVLISPKAEEGKGGLGGFGLFFTIGEKQYRINNQYYEMDTDTKLVNGKTYVPLRFLSQALGYNVMFNQAR